MKTKKTHNPVFTLRLEPRLRAELQREADADRRSLASYITILLVNHPGRKKPK